MHAISLVLGKVKSIWVLALLSNILYKKPCKAISWGVSFLLSHELYVTRTTEKNPSSSKSIFTKVLSVIQHCLEGQGEKYLKSMGGKREVYRSMIVPSHLRQMSTASCYASQVFMS